MLPRIFIRRRNRFKTPKEKCNNLEIIKPRKILASLHAAEFLPLKIPDADCKWVRLPLILSDIFSQNCISISFDVSPMIRTYPHMVFLVLLWLC